MVLYLSEPCGSHCERNCYCEGKCKFLPKKSTDNELTSLTDSTTTDSISKTNSSTAFMGAGSAGTSDNVGGTAGSSCPGWLGPSICLTVLIVPIAVYGCVSSGG